jgi:ribonuclease Z
MFSVQILGNSSATPAFARFPSSQVVNYNDRYFLVDAGEGVQMQLQRYKIKFSRLDGIFISHLHGDHILGFPGLVASLSIFERPNPLPVFAPRGLRKIMDVVLRESDTYIKYDIEYHDLEDYKPGDVIYQSDRLQVKLLPLEHRTFCRGFLFEEINKRRKFDFYKAKALGIPKEYFHLVKQENDITLPDGTFISCDEVLLPREEVLSYAYCSDTRYAEALIPYLKDVSLLYHEATFLHELKKRAEETYHSTALEAGQIAAQANARKLVLGHFSARYRELGPLLMEARSVFPNAELGLEGKIFDLKRDV